MGELTLVPCVVAIIASSIAAVTDVWRFRAYNALTIPLCLSGVVYHIWLAGWDGFSYSTAGLLFGFGTLIVPWLLGLMGAGDVKLLAGVGAWLGLPTTMVVFVVSSLVSGGYAVVLILIRGKIRDSLLTIELILYRFAALGMHFGRDDLVEQQLLAKDRRLRVIPFGAMIPIGIVGTLIWFYWFK